MHLYSYTMLKSLKLPNTSLLAISTIASQGFYSTSSKNVGAVCQSFADKGFLRPYKPYNAPDEVARKLESICTGLGISLKTNIEIQSIETKFKILAKCFSLFNHSVPNSQIHDLKTLGDIIKFYETSVVTTVPYDTLARMELPENLHIQHDYVRFNRETDTKFNGQTAFPKSSTLVTGLKYRGKYTANEAKRMWP